jgi:hypothetical protein
MRQEAASSRRSDCRGYHRIVLPLFDGHFKLEQSRREATHGRLRCAVRLCVAGRVSMRRRVFARRHEQEITNMRAIRGQRRQWLCFCGRAEASNAVSWPMLPMEPLNRAVSAWLRSLFKKRASFSSQSSAPSSGPENAAVSTLRVCDGKPPQVIAQTVFGVPESLCHCSTDTFQTQAVSLRSDTWAASVRYTTVHCMAGVAGTKRHRATTQTSA